MWIAFEHKQTFSLFETCKDKYQDHQGEKSWRGLLYEINKLEEEKDLSKTEASDKTKVSLTGVV